MHITPKKVTSTYKILLALVLAGLLTSCASYRKDATRIAHGMGLIMTDDLHHVWAWEDVLHKKTGYTNEQVEVVACTGSTQINIYSVNIGESKQALAQRIKEVARIDPDVFGPTNVSIK